MVHLTEEGTGLGESQSMWHFKYPQGVRFRWSQVSKTCHLLLFYKLGTPCVHFTDSHEEIEIWLRSTSTFWPNLARRPVCPNPGMCTVIPFLIRWKNTQKSIRNRSDFRCGFSWIKPLFIHWKSTPYIGRRFTEMEITIVQFMSGSLWRVLKSCFSNSALMIKILGLVNGTSLVLVISQLVIHLLYRHSKWIWFCIHSLYFFMSFLLKLLFHFFFV